MALEDLKKQIYRPEADLSDRTERPDILDLGKEPVKGRQDWDTIEKSNKKFKLTDKQKKLIKRIAMIGGALVLVLAALAIWQQMTSFDKHNVTLEVSGPNSVVSGDELTYDVAITNKTRVSLNDVKLIVNFPEDSIPTEGSGLIQTLELPSIEKDQTITKKIKVRLVGAKGQEKETQIKLDYQPASFKNRYSSQEEIKTTISSVLLSLDFDLPRQLVSGQDFSFSLEYINSSDIDFNDLELRVEYPDGFKFQSAVPLPSERENIWKIAELKEDDQRKISVAGTIEGNEGDVKQFRAKLGKQEGDRFVVLVEKVEPTEISSSPLFISQTIGGASDYIAKAGDLLKYKVNFKNTTGVGINSVFVTVKLESSAIDFSSLDLSGGSFDASNNTIVWRASNLPELAFLDSNESGSVEFVAKVKSTLPINSYSDKNFTVLSTATVDSENPPLALKDIRLKGEDRMETKIASSLEVRAKGFFNDNDISNSGPIPPKVGQTTTYTLRWELSNTSNDLSDVKVTASLPPHVKWKNVIKPLEADLEYDSGTGKVTWLVGDLAAGTSIILPTEWVAWQVAITPAQVNVKSYMELIGTSKVTGHDTFADVELTDTDQPIDTDLPDDLAIGRAEGQVVE